jgi:chromosomal replication initiation ATPase DnaA
MNSCQIQIVENLVLKASEILNVPATEIKGKGKKEECCIARGLVWVVCKHDLSISFRSIAKLFNRDHTSVWSGYSNMMDEIEVNKERRNVYKELVNG